MIFQFPDLETLRLAITSAQVPANVSAAPAEVAFDSAGRPSVRPVAGIPSKAMQAALKKLGVKTSNTHYSDGIVTVECWPQVLPVVKQSGGPAVTATTPVLFEMPAAGMAAVVTEVLRLGNDRQSFRTLAGVDGAADRVLLKVIGPPYYTLLRAIDQSAEPGAAVTAFIERAPRMWVELGHDHPLAAKIKPAAGQLLLLRPERAWTAVADEPFRDIYEILDFTLPAAAVEWQASQLKGKLAVPLRLSPGNAADGPEMWVLRDEAIGQLDALVRDANERLMQRLAFAVATEADGTTTVVLRTRPSRLLPPVLTLDAAIGYKAYHKLPNLFLPVGTRLMPTLRREAVRRLLADDPAQIVWLTPLADGKFSPETLPDDAFRPLEDWVDYVIDHDRAALESWVQATRFDFDAFVCSDEAGDRPKAPPADRIKGKRKSDEDGDSRDATAAPPLPKGKTKRTDKAAGTDFLIAEAPQPPAELKVKLDALEKAFLDTPGSLDVADRQALWPQLARTNAALHDPFEAAICWMNAFWESPEIPAEGAWEWLRSEDRAARRDPTAAEFAAVLDKPAPATADIRTLVARVVYACQLEPVPPALLAVLPRVRDFLERHEGLLGVRAVWLAWSHLVRVGTGPADVLGLARVRDRLLQRLLSEGLNRERDLPKFLQIAGAADAERIRIVRDRAMRVHRLVMAWHAGEEVKVNEPYVDLLFAFGMAKLGEATAARDLIATASAKAFAGEPDPAREFLVNAFIWRIENALAGKPHSGPLPPAMMAKLATLDEGRGNNLGWGYPVNRLREQSWVLEPESKQDPYAPFKKFPDDLMRSLADLATISDAPKLEEAVKKLLRNQTAPARRILVFAAAVSQAARIGEDFAVALIRQVPAALEEYANVKATVPEAERVAAEEKSLVLLERSLFLAAHYARPDLVQAVFARFLDYVAACPATEAYAAVNKIARECLRGLRKMGLKEEIDRFLKQMTDILMRGKTLPQLRSTAGTAWPEILTSLLNLAEGWLFFGIASQAKPILDEARTVIFANRKSGAIKFLALTKLVRAYIAAVTQGPVADALDRIEELFRNLEKLPNTLTTSAHFSRLHLNVVEDVVRSLVSDHFATGDQARRWLDDDEYLVRRRVHADMRHLLAQSGLS